MEGGWTPKGKWDSYQKGMDVEESTAASLHHQLPSSPTQLLPVPMPVLCFDVSKPLHTLSLPSRMLHSLPPIARCVLGSGGKQGQGQVSIPVGCPTVQLNADIIYLETA